MSSPTPIGPCELERARPSGIPAPARSPRRGSTVVWVLAGLAAAAAAFRLVAFAHALTRDQLPADDVNAHYVEHPWVITLHLVPALLFVLLGPLQFRATLRRRWPAWHRAAGRVFVLSGLAVALTSLWMNEYFPPVGGFGKYSANVVFGLGLIATIGLSMRAILRADVRQHRAWMVRAFAIGLGAATQRLWILPMYLAVGELTDGVITAAVWLGWVGNLFVAEAYLRQRPATPLLSRGRAAPASAGR